MDVGTGDGRTVLAWAARERETLVVGIDPVAEAMTEASRRAGRPGRKGGLPNALFVLASAEGLPCELAARADAVTVNLPWGSLLRGILEGDAGIVGGLAGLLVPGGALEMLVSVEPRDALGNGSALDLAALERLAPGYRALGLKIETVRPASEAELRESRSTWARRLLHDRRRRVWKVCARRC